jgi:dsDNA-binding SOS-regulon protein
VEAVSIEEEIVKAAEAFFLARGKDRVGTEAELRRAVKQLRAERADEENERQAA